MLSSSFSIKGSEAFSKPSFLCPLHKNKITQIRLQLQRRKHFLAVIVEQHDIETEVVELLVSL